MRLIPLGNQAKIFLLLALAGVAIAAATLTLLATRTRPSITLGPGLPQRTTEVVQFKPNATDEEIRGLLSTEVVRALDESPALLQNSVVASDVALSLLPIVHGRYDAVLQRAQSRQGSISLSAEEVDFIVRRGLRSMSSSGKARPAGYEDLSAADWERYIDSAPAEDLMGIPFDNMGAVALLRIVSAKYYDGGSPWVSPQLLLNDIGQQLGLSVGSGFSAGKAKFLPREFSDHEISQLSFPRLNLVMLGETTDGRSFLLCITLVDTPSWPWAPFLWTAAMPQDPDSVFLPQF